MGRNTVLLKRMDGFGGMERLYLCWQLECILL